MNVYQRTTKDMLMNFGLPLSSGYGSIPYNMGKMTNKGFESGSQCGYSDRSRKMDSWRKHIPEP